jgi:hypothetical protein
MKYTPGPWAAYRAKAADTRNTYPDAKLWREAFAVITARRVRGLIEESK